MDDSFGRKKSPVAIAQGIVWGFLYFGLKNASFWDALRRLVLQTKPNGVFILVFCRLFVATQQCGNSKNHRCQHNGILQQIC